MSDEAHEQNKVVLDLSGVRKRLKKRAELLSEVAALDRELDAAKLFIDSKDWKELTAGESMSAPLVSDGKRIRKGTWTGGIMETLKKSGGVLTYDELKEAILSSHLGARFKQSDKGFYGAIGKLNERGEIVKLGGRLYTAQAYARLQSDIEQGRREEPEPVKTAHSRSPLGEFVSEYIAQHPKGVHSKEILEHVRAQKELGASARRNSTGLYNVLARLVKQEKVQKSGTYYFPIGVVTHHPNDDSQLDSSSDDGAELPLDDKSAKGAANNGDEKARILHS